MREILNVVMSMYDDYNGAGMQMALFFACLIYLLVQKKDKEKRYVFLGYTLLFFIICFCPATAKVIMICIEETVYWRMFWLLPAAIVTAYTAVLIIMQAEPKKRYLFLGVMLLVVGMTGSVVYNSTIFARSQNYYKLPRDVVDICDIIEEDAAANGIDQKKLIVGNNLVSFIRQYDAQILMPYGMETIRGGRTENENDAQIFRIMSSDVKDWEVLAWYAAMENCNYLAYPLEGETADELLSYGYSIVGDNGVYRVYRRDFKEEDYVGEWLITQYGGADGEPLSFYTMQDREGHLIVIDGGRAEDVSYVRKQINALGGHVDAWIITHPHGEHAGAFMEIYKKPKKIQIDRIYTIEMPEEKKILPEDPRGEDNLYEQWQALEIPEKEIVYAKDAFEVEGLAFQIFNAYDDYVDEWSEDPLNDGSLVFRVTAGRESMLFCSDVGEAVSDYLLNTYGESLKSDYVQMADHGNHGLKSDFYIRVGAKGAFFDAPNQMMQDMSGIYDNLQNAYDMLSNGVSVYSFATTPNQIILK